MKNFQKNLGIFNKSELDYMNNLVNKIKLPYMSNAEILENIQDYRFTNNSIYLDRVINNFIKLLIKSARKYKKPSIDVGDLIHYGVEALIEAVSKTFNLKSKEKFITYATIIIERRIKDGVDTHRRTVELPKNIMIEQRKLQFKYHNNFKTDSFLNDQKSQNTSTYLLYSKMNIVTKYNFEDVIVKQDQQIPYNTNIEDKLDKESLQFDVFYILDILLTPIERDIIIHSFGLNGEVAKVLDIISILLNMSSQKVGKIRNDALLKMKNNKKCIDILKKYLN